MKMESMRVKSMEIEFTLYSRYIEYHLDELSSQLTDILLQHCMYTCRKCVDANIVK